MLQAVRGARPEKPPSTSRSLLWLRGLRATVALLFALVLVLISALVHKSSPTIPSFYAWSGALPDNPASCCVSKTPRTGCPRVPER